MKVELAYGRGALSVDLPDERATAVGAVRMPGLPDAEGAIAAALRNPIGAPPLRRAVQRGQSVAIAVGGISRPAPVRAMLSAALNELRHIPPSDIAAIAATGARRASAAELADAFGGDIAAACEVVGHDAYSAAGLTSAGAAVGDIDGMPISLNRRWAESDIRIAVGIAAPHMFTGFSGGPNVVAPGLAGVDAITALLGGAAIGHPKARWGVVDGNPIYDAARRIARAAGADFGVEATINRGGGITSVYAGDALAAHKAARGVAARLVMRSVREPFDVVVTSGGGWPLDRSLCAAAGAISAAAQVLRRGGTIICAAECADGVPDGSEFARALASGGALAADGATLASGGGTSDALDMARRHWFKGVGHWRARALAGALARGRVALKSDGLTRGQARAVGLTLADDVESAVAECGAGARICALPDGPLVVPYIA